MKLTNEQLQMLLQALNSTQVVGIETQKKVIELANILEEELKNNS